MTDRPLDSAFWNQRYAGDDLFYGAAPNDFLIEAASKLPRRGAALDIGAGEGRNAIYLASLGLDVLAIDQSSAGMNKAARWASERGLRMQTRVADLESFDPPPESYDVVSSIFVHLPAALRQRVLQQVHRWLRPGGFLVLEAYTPEQLPRDTGGPKDPDRLASLATLKSELAGLELVIARELERVVIEGAGHGGLSSVVQILARKP